MKRAWIILGLLLWPAAAFGQTLQVGWGRGAETSSLALPGGAIVKAGQKLCLDGTTASLSACDGTYLIETSGNVLDTFVGGVGHLRLTADGLYVTGHASAGVANPTSELTIRSGSASGAILTIHPYTTASNRTFVVSEASGAGLVEVYNTADTVTVTLTGSSGAGTFTGALSAATLSLTSTAAIQGALTLNSGSNTYAFPTTRGTATYVLTTNGDGTTSWAAPASGSLTGSGTAGYVPYYSAATVLTSEAAFTYDAGTNTLTAGNFAGVGTNLTALNASNITSGTISTDRISGLTTADLSASAGIVDTQLATISTAGKVSNSATTATSANTASAIVARDGSGNFSAGTITASLTGLASQAAALKSTATTGLLSITGPATGTTRAKTVRDADDTLLELGGTYTPTGTWTWSSATVSGIAETAITDGSTLARLAGNETISGTWTFSQSPTFSNGLKVATTKALYLDGGSNTYLVESAADTLKAYTGGTLAAKINSNQRLVLGASIDGAYTATNHARKGYLTILSDLSTTTQVSGEGVGVSVLLGTPGDGTIDLDAVPGEDHFVAFFANMDTNASRYGAGIGLWGINTITTSDSGYRAHLFGAEFDIQVLGSDASWHPYATWNSGFAAENPSTLNYANGVGVVLGNSTYNGTAAFSSFVYMANTADTDMTWWRYGYWAGGVDYASFIAEPMGGTGKVGGVLSTAGVTKNPDYVLLSRVTPDVAMIASTYAGENKLLATENGGWWSITSKSAGGTEYTFSFMNDGAMGTTGYIFSNYISDSGPGFTAAVPLCTNTAGQILRCASDPVSILEARVADLEARIAQLEALLLAKGGQ